MCLSITVGGIQDSLLSTVNGVLAQEFGLPIEKIENLSSYPLLASGVTCAVASILARIVGKRPIYVASTTILLITCIWSALIGTDFDSFFAARLISGIGLGSYEALVLSSIGDMYFASESHFSKSCRGSNTKPGSSTGKTSRVLEYNVPWTNSIESDHQRLCCR